MKYKIVKLDRYGTVAYKVSDQKGEYAAYDSTLTGAIDRLADRLAFEVIMDGTEDHADLTVTYGLRDITKKILNKIEEKI